MSEKQRRAPIGARLCSAQAHCLDLKLRAPAAPPMAASTGGAVVPRKLIAVSDFTVSAGVDAAGAVTSAVDGVAAAGVTVAIGSVPGWPALRHTEIKSAALFSFGMVWAMTISREYDTSLGFSALFGIAKSCPANRPMISIDGYTRELK